MTSSTNTCMEYITKIRDNSGAPNFKEVSNFLTFLQETFTPLLSDRDADIAKQSSEKVTIADTLHSKSSKKQRIPDVKSQYEFPALSNVLAKKISPRTPSRLRRINPTPVGKGTTTFQSGTSQFTVNPVFTAGASPDSAASLQEERRLLAEERSQSRSKFGKKQSRSVQLSEIISSTIRAVEDNVSSKEIVSDGRDDKQESSSGVSCLPVLSAVTDKLQLDSIAQCYSSLIKGHLVPNITSQLYFVLQLLTVSPARATCFMDIKSPFSSISNCVYFAVTVISNVNYLFSLLDGQMLYSLSQCSRIEEFSPDLSKYFMQCYEGKGTHGMRVSPDYHVFGVPFQEEFDNRKNFTSDKAFHSFKKQRDMFYELLKNWEKIEDKQHNQREKMKSLMECDSSGLPHFAKLFQRQLVENSRHSQTINNIEESENALVNDLKKSNPSKFRRLNERFSKLSSHGGPCPSPCFTQQEQFYTEFLLATDSYGFNQLLKQQIFSEILKLNTRSEFHNTEELSDTIITLKVLAKYLGFLVFLPYQNAPVTAAVERSQVEPYDILQCVKDSYTDSNRLCVTIPWVVEFCVMMDTQAPTVPYYHQLLTSLIVIYRFAGGVLCAHHFNTQTSSLFHRSLLVVRESKSLTTGHMMLLTSLGWLFELHTVTNGIFYDEILQSSDATCNLSMDGTIHLVDDTLLLKCCPYLGELHKVLSEFAAGRASNLHKSSVRKIKPVSVTSDDFSVQKERRMQAELQENFFRNQPSYLRKLCEVIAERISSNVVTYSEQQIIPCCVLIGLKDLVDVVKLNISNNTEDVEHSLNIPMVTMAQTTQKCTHLVVQRSHDHFNSYCRVTSKSSLHPLLVDAPSEQILDAVASITVSMTRERHWKWICQEARGLVCKELEKQFVNMKKTIISTMKTPVGDRLLRSREFLNEEDFYKSTGKPIATSVHSLPGYDVLKDKVKQLMSSVEITSLDQDANELTLAISSMTEQLARQLFILPDVLVAQLVPRCCSELVSVTVQLAVQLVSQGRLRWNNKLHHFYHTPVQTMECTLLTTLVTLWRLLKGVATLPAVGSCDQLLSHDAFQLYISTVTNCSTAEQVWSSLSETLVTLLHHNICSSPAIEASWMCRIDELRDSPAERDHCLRAASVFLELFYSSNEDVDMTLSSESVAAVPGSLGRMRDVHFVRLLSAILESAIANTSLVLTSRSSISKLVHPI